jgi:DNA-binding HxlR family transcriptional regulator
MTSTKTPPKTSAPASTQASARSAQASSAARSAKRSDKGSNTTSAPLSAKTAPRSQQRAKEAINAALELFNRRWALRVLWELRGVPMSFRALQSACGDLSPTVLNQRLAELREAALVDAGEAGYALTPLGHELIVAFEPLTAWALRWQGRRP